MKALLLYPELPLSFWSFKKSVRHSGKKAPFPPLGLTTLAALLPTEWELRLVDLNCRSLKEDDWAWADMAMISAMIAQDKELAPLTRKAKDKGAIVVAGGPCPTSVPNEMLELGVDFVVRGEAENTIPHFLEVLGNTKPGVVIETKEKPDITKSPVPRFDLLRLDDYVDFSIQTSRGCPFECEFCDVISIFGRKPRYKNPEQVILELEALYKLGARGHIFICDDNFIGNKIKARELLKRLILWNKEREEPFGFNTQASLNLGQDLEMIDLMTAANFGEVFIGIESPDEKAIELSRKYQNLQNPIVESIDNICRNGLAVQGSFIIGFDGEKRGAGKRICDLVDQTLIPLVMINTLHAPPNTKLWQRLEKEERLLEKIPKGEDGTFSKPNFVTDRPLEEIIKEKVDAWTHIYDPSLFLKRTYEYHLKMRPTRRAMALSKGEDTTSHLPDRNPPLKTRLRELYIFIHLLWHQGIRPHYRLQFWKQLFGMWKRNPSRMHKYIISCVMGEDIFEIRDLVRKKFFSNQPK
ncbi:B12-binding domain-containing radical SAM protein [Thermodesulfobacteriota bacterium]